MIIMCLSRKLKLWVLTYKFKNETLLKQNKYIYYYRRSYEMKNTRILIELIFNELSERYYKSVDIFKMK